MPNVNVTYAEMQAAACQLQAGEQTIEGDLARLKHLVSLEQIVLRVKCDSGEVCCHQHVGTQSASDRSRVSIRYWGLPSLRTSMSPARVHGA